MWTYNKLLQYPINIKNRNPKMAKVIISQYGGPDGELAAALRYLSQKFAMPSQIAKATLNDIGTEELAHLEMVGTLVHQLTDGVCPEELQKAGLGAYYTDHGVEKQFEAVGNGPIDAVQRGLQEETGVRIKVLDYEEHALQSGSNSQAAAYIHLLDSDDGSVTYGVGVSSNITRASVRAIFSAMNRLGIGK